MIDKKVFTKYVWAFTLGDGGLRSLKRYNITDSPRSGDKRHSKPKNSSYYLNQKDDHRDYVDWQASILKNLTTVSIKHYDPYVDKRRWDISGQYRLNTKCHPLYTKMRQRIYLDDRKIINPHDLKQLDWECLAIFYQDDGWLKVEQRKTKSSWVRVNIASMSFSYGDNYLLKKAIFEKVGIPFDIHKRMYKSGWKYYLRTTKDNALRFIEGVSKYILPSFEYKINLSDR